MDTRPENSKFIALLYAVGVPAVVALVLMLLDISSSFLLRFLLQMLGFAFSFGVVRQIICRARRLDCFRGAGILIGLSLCGNLLVDLLLFTAGLASDDALAAGFLIGYYPVVVLAFAAGLISLSYIGVLFVLHSGKQAANHLP
jgi:hypothetical protein